MLGSCLPLLLSEIGCSFRPLNHPLHGWVVKLTDTFHWHAVNVEVVSKQGLCVFACVERPCHTLCKNLWVLGTKHETNTGNPKLCGPWHQWIGPRPPCGTKIMSSLRPILAAHLKYEARIKTVVQVHIHNNKCIKAVYFNQYLTTIKSQLPLITPLIFINFLIYIYLYQNNDNSTIF